LRDALSLKEMAMRNMLPVFFTCELLAGPVCADAPQQEQDTVVARVDDDGVQRASIVGGNYFFKPRHLVLKANLPVELSLSREAGIVPHTLVIKAPEAAIVLDQVLGPEVRKLRFTPTGAGTYPLPQQAAVFQEPPGTGDGRRAAGGARKRSLTVSADRAWIGATACRQNDDLSTP
jgi:hypothetical protein